MQTVFSLTIRFLVTNCRLRRDHGIHPSDYVGAGQSLLGSSYVSFEYLLPGSAGYGRLVLQSNL